MCGLAGIFELDGAPVATTLVSRMADALAHRGPDGRGAWTGGGAGLGHRRLAVIDLTPGGRQPMMTPDGRYVIAYNGELYNFAELRAELAAVGHRFYTATDTEVVLAAFAAWGPECLDRFNGMFAFAVFDKVERTMFLARDRYGVKPLYYAYVGRTLMFASEVKALIEHPDLRVRLSAEALHEYFTFQNIFSDRTLFAGVKMLQPGHFLRVPQGMASLPAPTRYWDFELREDHSADERETTDRVAHLFEQAVQRQLVADVDVGTYLSGGIDSGSIACMAARVFPNLKSFTVGFDMRSASGLEVSFDEREKAEYLSGIYKTEHYAAVLKAGDMERAIEKVVWHLEDPRVGQSYPNWYAAGLASRFVKVVLSGTGSDELFAGYPWRYHAVVNDNASADDYLERYYATWQRLIPDELKPSFFRPSLYGNGLDAQFTRDVFKSVHQGTLRDAKRPEDFVNSSLYFELKTFLHGLLLVEDKLHMAHGIEARVPFLDNDLVDFAQTVPVRHKLRHLQAPERIDENVVGHKPDRYFRRTNDGKLILRRVLSRYVPDEISYAAKQGFSAPDASWFKGESVDYLRNLFFRGDAHLFEYLERDTVRGMLNEHFSGQKNRRLLIWSFLCFEHWLRLFQPEGVA